MNIRHRKIHQEIVSATFSIGHIEALLVDALIKESGLKVDSNTKQHVLISTRPMAGTAGTEYYAEVSITNNIKES